MFSGGNERRTYGAAGPLCECWWTCRGGEHMSECSGSDTVFIALPSAHFREVRIECHLTKRPFFFSSPPSQISQVQTETFLWVQTEETPFLCLFKSGVTQTDSGRSSQLTFVFSLKTHTQSRNTLTLRRSSPPPQKVLILLSAFFPVKPRWARPTKISFHPSGSLNSLSKREKWGKKQRSPSSPLSD